jgi:Tol biopolymer transport system component
LPDGRHVLYHASGSADVSGIWVSSIDGGETTRLLPSDTGAVYDARNGVLLFGRQGTLMGQRFDPATFALSGDPFPIAERVETDVVPGVVAFSVSDTGVLAYGMDAAAESALELVWFNRQGNQTGTLGPPANYRGIDLSPDGTRVAAHRHDGEGGDIWITEVSSGRSSRFTFEATQENASPVWSPDGSRIAYSSKRSGRPGLYVKNADNTADDQRILEIDMARGDMPPQPQSWSSDGSSVLFGMTSGVPILHDLWLVPLSGDHKATPILNTPSPERWGQFSPDGKWIAYVTNETGAYEVYVRSATLGGGKWAVSTGGGSVPRWRADSRELFYFGGGKILAVGITPTGGAVAVGAPTPVVDLGNVRHDSNVVRNHTDLFWYAVAKDGQRILVSRPVAASDAPSPIVIVTDWIEGIRR